MPDGLGHLGGPVDGFQEGVSLELGDGSSAGRFGDEVVQDPSQRSRVRFSYEIKHLLGGRARDLGVPLA